MKNTIILILFTFFAPFLYSQNTTSKIESNTIIASIEVPTKNVGLGDNYATLYIYRPKSRKRSLASFTINVNDSAVCKIKSNKRYVVKIYKLGLTEIWAKSEYKSTVTMNFEKAKHIASNAM